MMAREWDAFCRSASIDGATAHLVVERLYPDRERGQPLDPAWDALRGALEYFVPPRRAGEAPDAGKLGTAISKRLKGSAIRTHDAPAPLRRFVAVGKSGGRTRWAVEDVPAYQARSGAGARVHVVPEPPPVVAAPPPVAAPVEPDPAEAYADLVARLRAQEDAGDGEPMGNKPGEAPS